MVFNLRLPFALATVLATVAATGACSKSTPGPAADAPAAPAAPAAPQAALGVSDISLGRAIGPDKAVTMPMTAFGTRDTIYASVTTEGAPATATLAARWSYLGEGAPAFVDSTAQTIAPTGRAVTEFHVSKSDGWPAGAYRVEIFADGRPVGTREFEVR